MPQLCVSTRANVCVCVCMPMCNSTFRQALFVLINFFSCTVCMHVRACTCIPVSTCVNVFVRVIKVMLAVL